MTRTLVNALRTPAFSAGLRPGLVALAVALVLAVSWRTTGGCESSPSLPPVVGLLLAAAVMFGLASIGRLSDGLVLGLAVLGIGGLLADVLEARPLVLAVLVAPGAWILAVDAGLVDVVWVQFLVGAATVAGSVLVTDFDARWADQGAGPVLVALTASAVWATVPDTEQALVLLGAALPLVLLGWPRVVASLGPGGSSVIAGLIAWTAAAGGAGRLSSIIGGIGSLGLFVVEPLSNWLTQLRGGSFGRMEGRRSALVPLASTHLVLVFVASRYAGLQRTVSVAAWIAGVALCGGVLLGVLAADGQARSRS